jgi:hypothetical protein
LASLIEELINIIEEETGCYKTFLELANNKKDVIINGDLPGLQEITMKEQEVAGQLLRLERKRNTNLEDICLVTNSKLDDFTISSLIQLLSNQEDEKNKLEKASKELQNILEEVKLINETNRKLTEQSLECIEFTMNAIQSTNSKNISNSYETKGKLTNNYEGQNFFDAKQ